MALEKEHSYKGIVASYWKINGVVTDVVEDKTVVTLSLYANKEARDADIKNLLINSNFTFKGVDYSREELYAKIKEPVYFPGDEESVDRNILTDAKDC